MKIFLLLPIVLLLGCPKTINDGSFSDVLPNEQFKDINPAEFNATIKDRMDIENGEALIRLYYPQQTQGEGNEKITIETTDLKKGIKKIVLIHDNLLDDSQKGMKLIMIAQQSRSNWDVKLIKKNWTCRKGRGHTDWGIEPCS